MGESILFGLWSHRSKSPHQVNLQAPGQFNPLVGDGLRSHTSLTLSGATWCPPLPNGETLVTPPVSSRPLTCDVGLEVQVILYLVLEKIDLVRLEV